MHEDNQKLDIYQIPLLILAAPAARCCNVSHVKAALEHDALASTSLAGKQIQEAIFAVEYPTI